MPQRGSSLQHAGLVGRLQAATGEDEAAAAGHAGGGRRFGIVMTVPSGARDPLAGARAHAAIVSDGLGPTAPGSAEPSMTNKPLPAGHLAMVVDDTRGDGGAHRQAADRMDRDDPAQRGQRRRPCPPAQGAG